MTEEQLQLREELRVECKFGNLERINKLIELGADLNWGATWCLRRWTFINC